MDERLEDHDGMQRWFEFAEWAEANELASGEKLTAAQEKEFEDLFPEREALALDAIVVTGSVLVEEWESIVPPNELAVLHSTAMVLIQGVVGERDISRKELDDLILARRGALEEVKNNLTLGEYARVADAGCLDLETLLSPSLTAEPKPAATAEPKPTATAEPEPTPATARTLASNDEYAAWCQGRDERVRERVEERLKESGLFGDAAASGYIEAMWATLIEEYEPVVPPSELSALHDLYMTYYQFQSDVESRLRAIKSEDINESSDPRIEIYEESDEWQERWDEDHKSLRKELLTSIPLLDYRSLGEAGCLELVWR